MGMNNIGIFNGTVCQSVNRKSTIKNGETCIDKMGQKLCKENFSFTIGGFNNIGLEMDKIWFFDFDLLFEAKL